MGVLWCDSSAALQQDEVCNYWQVPSFATYRTSIYLTTLGRLSVREGPEFPASIRERWLTQARPSRRHPHVPMRMRTRFSAVCNDRMQFIRVP